MAKSLPRATTVAAREVLEAGRVLAFISVIKLKDPATGFWAGSPSPSPRGKTPSSGFRRIVSRQQIRHPYRSEKPRRVLVTGLRFGKPSATPPGIGTSSGGYLPGLYFLIF